MTRPRLPFLIAACLMAGAPLPAMAQAWQATVVAAAPRAAPAQTLSAARTPAADARRQAVILRTEPQARPLDLSPAEDAPEVDIQPKAEWSDDEGLRLTPTRLAFKRRF
ncbi:MAG: hypothetical protein JNK30_06480 [Phenylobacterium sp.]|uniref:hypothetical protein n=1 Tax=Phenylobacterium sp. TaxID=1871053 RepID=UPI001A620B52|nr:hypothetical protein [Phenylobacterium sp.]MBL8771013.1 hypothetical protein [Phenylobacterium sp.]